MYFDESGLCNHCLYYDEKVAPLKRDRSAELNKLLSEIKSQGKGKPYDCVIGVSGGTDSSYVAHLVKEFGLRPLAVHCDNGWNTELAVSNIRNMLEKLGIHLYTHVINWEEFKDIQLAYLKASVIDVEAPTDHAISAVLFREANKRGIKFILSGENFTTEGYMPESWIHWKNDLVNLRAIHKKFGKVPIKTFPMLGFVKQWYYENMRNIRYVHLLDYVPYIKTDAKKLLAERYDWRDYGGKHYESVITRFYQSYILPKKFNVDKRYSHLSTLICNGQMTRQEALAEVSQPPYDFQKTEADKQYVIKKLGLTDAAFDALMQLPVRQHTDYPSLLNRADRVRPLINLYKRLRGLPVIYPTRRPRSIAMLLDNPFERDYRVFLEATTLARYYDVTMFAVRDPRLPDYEIIQGVKVRRVFDNDIHRLPKRGHLHKHARFIARKGFGIIHAHDHLMLDVGHRIKKLQPDCKLVYDSHELFHSWPMNLNDPSLAIRFKSIVTRRAQIILEKQHAKSIDRLVTVNTSLADNLKPYFNLSTNPVVLRNTPPLLPLQKGQHLLRRAFGLSEHTAILVFIGMHVYPKTLNLETVMDQVGNKPNLVFILICKADHNRRAIENYAKAKGYHNVLFHDVLKMDEIQDYLCDCDAGLVPTWNKKDLSYWLALDNKLFNYSMAAIPILATAQPEYKNIVEGFNIGVCVNPDEPDAYWRGLEFILNNREHFDCNAMKARQELNWEHESAKLLDLYRSLTSESQR